MRSFDKYLQIKLSDDNFAGIYKRECHVCKHTVNIFEKISTEGLSESALATELGINIENISLLRDADFCDPELTFRICEHLKLPVPKTCPRLK